MPASRPVEEVFNAYPPDHFLVQLSAATSGCALQKAKGCDQHGKYIATYDVLSADCLAINENDRDNINYRIAASRTKKVIKLLTVMELDT